MDMSELFHAHSLVDNLCHHDSLLVFADYVACQDKVAAVWKDQVQ